MLNECIRRYFFPSRAKEAKKQNNNNNNNNGNSEGRAFSKFVTNWGGSNLFYSQLGEGHNFFAKEKITPCRFYFVYTCKATSQD